MDHAAYCTLTRDEIDRYADTIDGADLSAPVPTCPGWTVLALTKHLGVVHRWAAQMLRDGATERLDFRDVDRNLPADPSGYAAWDGTSMACPYVAALAALVLERYPRIRTGDGRQPESVRAILRASAADLGMPPFLQGYGLPLATQALGVSY